MKRNIEGHSHTGSTVQVKLDLANQGLTRNQSVRQMGGESVGKGGEGNESSLLVSIPFPLLKRIIINVNNYHISNRMNKI